MRYRLKDRNRQREIRFAYLNFDYLLQKICEREFHNAEDAIEFVASNEWTGIKTTFQIAKTAIEEIPEFNPHSWNDWPDIQPPSLKLMRVEYRDKYGSLRRTCAQFSDVCSPPGWIDFNGNDIEATELKFRPWED